jgi:repressor LexA
MTRKAKTKRSSETPSESRGRYTAKQGQYLAYLYWYRKLHRCSPAESEIVQYFRVSPPSVHQMIVKLEEMGLITREPGVPRSIRVAVPRSEIPELESEEEDSVAVRNDAAGREAGW